MPEVRIKTNFGEVMIPYTNLTDLKSHMKDIDKVIEFVNSQSLPGFDSKKIDVKPGFEKIYTINNDGSVSLLKAGTKTENIGIVLFAFDPEPLKVEVIKKYTSISKPSDFMKGKYFNKLEHGSYKLSTEGLNWITGEIGPKLNK